MKTCRNHSRPEPFRAVFLALLLIACASGTAKASTKPEHLYLLAGTPTQDSASGFPVRLYSVSNGHLALVRQVAAGLFSVTNDLKGHLYVLNLKMSKLSVIHENAPEKIDAIPAPTREGPDHGFAFYSPTWGAVAGPGISSSVVFADWTDRWRVTRIFAHTARGEPRVARGSWNLYRYFRYGGSAGGPYGSGTNPRVCIVAHSIAIEWGGDYAYGLGVLSRAPPFLPLAAGLEPPSSGMPPPRFKTRWGGMLADTGHFFLFDAPLPENLKKRRIGGLYLLNKKTGQWRVIKLPFYWFRPRVFSSWVATTVQEPNPEGRLSPGLDNERAMEVDDGQTRELPRVRGMYPSNVYMPGKLLLQNLVDGRKLTIDTGQQDSEVLDVRKNGLVLYRVNNEIFEAHIEGNKLSAPKLVVKGEDVPEVHWAFWSKAVTKPHAAVAPHKKPPITVRLEAPKQPLKAGQPLLLSVKVTDISDHDVPVGITAGEAWGIGLIYQVHIRDQYGRAAPLKPLPPVPKRKGYVVLGGAASGHGVGLKPGQSVYDRVNVTYYYDLSRPGKYKIWVAEIGYRGPHGLVRSNTITVTVVK